MPNDGELACVCKRCEHKWVQQIGLPLEMGEFNRVLRKLKCPSCEATSKNISLVFGDAAKEAGFTRSQRRGEEAQ